MLAHEGSAAGYPGFGAGNAPIRLGAQARQDRGPAISSV